MPAITARGGAPWRRRIDAVLGLAVGRTLERRLERRLVFRTRGA